MSTKTGIAPAFSIAATLATAVCETVITSSPSPIWRPLSVSSIASVPFATPIECEVPIYSANFCSSNLTSSPNMNWFEFRTL